MPSAAASAADGPGADFWQQAWSSSPVALLACDAHGRVMAVNAAAERLLERPAAALIGHSPLDEGWALLDAAGRPLPAEPDPIVRTSRDREPLTDATLRLPLPDGGSRLLRLDTQPLPRPDGSTWVVASLCPAGARREPDATARRDHALMQALFQLVPFGLQLIDVSEGRSTAVNPALQAITGYSERELMEGDARQRFPDRWWPVRERWFQDARTVGRFGPSEVEYRHASGRLLNLVFSGVRVDGEHEAFLWLCVQDVSAYRAMEAQLRKAAGTDRLTGLANRSELITRLQALLSVDRGATAEAPGADAAPHATAADLHEPMPLAVLFFDFDRFKLVNDTLGHEAGDELLCAIAQRLRQTLVRLEADGGRPAGQLARFGGDEFVLLAPGVATDAQALALADALLQGLSGPFWIRQQAIHSTASIGITLWRPGQPATPESLLRDADTAMYEAKRQGRGRAVVVDEAMRCRLTRTLQLENALHEALSAGQLSVVYQPVVDLETGRIDAVEARLRWQHPELGAVPPEEFIPMAEESGRIVELGAWILREACRQWARWQADAPALAPARVSVHLSRVQVALGEGLVGTVSAALAEAGMPPAALQLEIAEQEVARSPQATRWLIEALSARGVSLAMDGFGTASASLGCLRDHPFDAVKLDRSFVAGLTHDPGVLAVAHATVQLIENLGMVSVAEGIENPSEAATLQALGCRYGQGDLFARPMPAEAVLPALAAAAGAGPGPRAVSPGSAWPLPGADPSPGSSAGPGSAHR